MSSFTSLTPLPTTVPPMVASQRPSLGFGPLLAAGGAAAGLLLVAAPALAHHLEAGQLPASLLAGFMSGLAHPLLGPDHLLVLLAIGLAGWRQPGRWIPMLVACSLLGSVAGLARPGLPGAELLVALSLMVAGGVALRRLPGWLMLPLIACHGYALSGVMVGAEPTPLGAYLLGLGLIQVLLLWAGVALCRRAERLRPHLAGLLIGVGLVSTLAIAFG
ncbi:MAG: HupE/UreJ family protein [Cyanobacteriota bacterium]|nr:HupE/UreJ family protein [Cyanobacteriota bacterium]